MRSQGGCRLADVNAAPLATQTSRRNDTNRPAWRVYRRLMIGQSFSESRGDLPTGITISRPRCRHQSRGRYVLCVSSHAGRRAARRNFIFRSGHLFRKSCPSRRVSIVMVMMITILPLTERLLHVQCLNENHPLSKDLV